MVEEEMAAETVAAVKEAVRRAGAKVGEREAVVEHPA